MIALPYMIRNAKFSLHGTARRHMTIPFIIASMTNEWRYVILDEDLIIESHKYLKGGYFIFHVINRSVIYYYADESSALEAFTLAPRNNIVSESTGILMAELYEMNEKNWFEYKINEALDSKDEEAFNKLMNSKLPNGLKVGTVFASMPDGKVIKLGSMEVNINEC